MTDGSDGGTYHGDAKLIIEGDIDDPVAPSGNIYELPNGHRYEMGTTHQCGVEGCPADSRGETMLSDNFEDG